MSLKDRTDSLWERVSLPQFQTLKENHQTSVCVVGGGMCGISTAYQLAKRGHKVTLVDAFRLASGQTCRTTAHLSSQLEEEFTQMLKMHDEKSVSLFYEAHRKAIDSFEQIIGQESIQCDFERLDGYLFLGRNERKHFLDKEQKAALKCGAHLDFLQETPYLKQKIPSLRYKAQAQFHPLKYLSGLVSVLKELNVPIFENTQVRDFHKHDDDTWTLTTDSGREIEAKYVVVATDSPVNTRFHIHTKQYAYRTYSIAFKYNGAMHRPVLLWDTEDPYHYIRFHKDEIIIGAEDHKVGQSPERDPFYNLEKWSRENIIGLGEVTWRWSGQVFEPADQMAYIGQSPGEDKNIFIATGFSGIGMTSSMIASHLLTDLIEGKSNPYAEIFDPSRKATHNLTEFIKENVNVAIQYKDYFTASEVKSEEEIPEDTGCLIRHGLVKSCVYHAAGDNFKRKTAICTHLGGIVHWNDIEKTWDCPAHGSRFNTSGKVIEGPAVSELGDQ